MTTEPIPNNTPPTENAIAECENPMSDTTTPRVDSKPASPPADSSSALLAAVNNLPELPLDRVLKLRDGRSIPIPTPSGERVWMRVSKDDPTITGIWHLADEEYEDDNGRTRYHKVEKRALVWAAIRIAKVTTDGKPDQVMYDVLVFSGAEEPLLLENLTEEDSLNPAKVAARVHGERSVPLPPINWPAYNYLRWALSSASLSGMRRRTRYERFGYHDGVDGRVAHLTLNGGVNGDGPTQDVRSEKPRRTDGRTSRASNCQQAIVFDRLPTIEDVQAVTEMLNLFPGRTYLAVSMLGALFAAFSGCGGVPWVGSGLSGNGKTWLLKVMNSWQSRQPSYLTLDLKKSSPLGALKQLGQMWDVLVTEDDLRQGRDHSATPQKAAETSIGAVYGDLLEAKSDSTGFEAERDETRAGLAISSEYPIEGAAGAVNRTIQIVGVKREWFDWELTKAFVKANDRQRRVTTQVITYMCRQADARGVLCPDGTVDSMRETAEENISRIAEVNIDEYARSAETVAAVEYGLRLLWAALTDRFGENCGLPDWDTVIAPALKELLEITGAANKAANESEVVLDAILGQLSAGDAFIAKSTAQDRPEFAKPFEDQYAHAGWQKDTFGQWGHKPNARYAGWLSDDHRLIYLENKWIRELPTRAELEVKPEGLKAAMIPMVPAVFDAEKHCSKSGKAYRLGSEFPNRPYAWPVPAAMLGIGPDVRRNQVEFVHLPVPEKGMEWVQLPVLEPGMEWVKLPTDADKRGSYVAAWTRPRLPIDPTLGIVA